MGIGTAPTKTIHAKSPAGEDCVLQLDTTDADNATSDAGIILSEAGVDAWYIGFSGSSGTNALGIYNYNTPSTMMSFANDNTLTISPSYTTFNGYLRRGSM